MTDALKTNERTALLRGGPLSLSSWSSYLFFSCAVPSSSSLPPQEGTRRELRRTARPYASDCKGKTNTAFPACHGVQQQMACTVRIPSLSGASAARIPVALRARTFLLRPMARPSPHSKTKRVRATRLPVAYRRCKVRCWLFHTTRRWPARARCRNLYTAAAPREAYKRWCFKGIFEVL